MKYKYLKDQNKAFKKEITAALNEINRQSKLIDSLTKEKIDLLSKLEIKTINKSNQDFMLYSFKKEDAK